MNADRNYWNDRRVKVRPHQHEGWKVDESRMVAVINVPEFCGVHGEGEHDDHPECAVCRRVGEIQRAVDAAPVVDGRKEVDLPEGHETFALPFKWGVCPTCSGKGSHVNPSIDCDGLTGEDFAEDPDFAESYFNGEYDQTCSECGGCRVVPELHATTPDEKAFLAALDVLEEEDAAYERLVRMERASGC